MTQLAQPTPATSNRSPLIAAVGFFVLLIVIAAVALLPKLRHRDALRTKATEAAGPPIVLATRLSSGDRNSRLELPATIQAFEQTTIFARTSGYIKDRYVDIGDHVRKGQLLAVIEDPQTAQSLLQAEATLAQTRAQLLQSQANAELSSVTNQRWQALQKAGVVAQQDADQKRAQSSADLAAVAAAKANITANQANVASLTQQASFSRVTAPFDGIVLSRSIDRGSLISVGSQNSVQPLFTVAQSNTVRVFTNVPQSNTVGLRDGQIAQVAVRELGGQTFPGTITRTSQSLDPGTRTLLVEVDLKNDGRILPGMYATVRFDLPPSATPPIMLPANALVIRTAGPQAVVIDQNSVAHYRPLVLGRDLGNSTEVLSGLKAGDLVVLSPGDDVVEGAKVKPEIQKTVTPSRIQPAMQTKQLGNSDLHLTPIGFGAWAIGGGDWQYGWGPQEDNESIAAIHRAIEHGINWIDTAAVYGLGHSEEVVARAMEGVSTKPYILTKCGMLWDENRKINQSLKSIRTEVEASLRRLKVDVIDLYQIHWPVPDEEIEEGWTAMAELQRQSKVRWIGVSNFSVAQMKRAQKIAPITSLQPPYSMINRSVEPEILPFCQQQGIGVINYSPMQSGLLTGKMTAERIANMPPDDFRRNGKQFQEPQLSRNLDLAALLGEIGSHHNVSAGVVAIAWTLHHPAVTAAIVGARSPQQVDGTLPATQFRLSNPEFSEIARFLEERP